MVSQRCIASVEGTLGSLGLAYEYVALGEAKMISEMTESQILALKANLVSTGFEVLEGKRQILNEKIKAIVLAMVRGDTGLPETNISYHIAEKMGHDYTYIANIFSELNGSTIERFIIRHKIERVKELIQDDELNFTEISYKMNYSSVAHLSNQFKKITGMTPSAYKKQKHKKRNNLEDI